MEYQININKEDVKEAKGKSEQNGDPCDTEFRGRLHRSTAKVYEAGVDYGRINRKRHDVQ